MSEEVPRHSLLLAFICFETTYGFRAVSKIEAHKMQPGSGRLVNQCPVFLIHFLQIASVRRV